METASKKPLPLLLLLLLALRAAVQAQFYCTTNNGTITITGYYGSGGAVIIPGTTNGLLVTGIGDRAFAESTTLTSIEIPNSVTNIGGDVCADCTSLTAITVGALNPAYSSLAGVLFDESQTTLTQYPPGATAGSYTIPDSVTNIGGDALIDCTSLTNITIPNSITSIGDSAFHDCDSLISLTIPNCVTSIGDSAFNSCDCLTSITIPNSVTNIGGWGFAFCPSLTNVTIGNSVTNIAAWAFGYCARLTGIYFSGNAPSADSSVFYRDTYATVYYLPWTSGWDKWVSPPQAVPWRPQVQTTDGSFGVQTNQFGFNITWASGVVVVVEACTNLINPAWSPVQTDTLTGGSSYFSDPQWTNYPARFYRLRTP